MDPSVIMYILAVLLGVVGVVFLANKNKKVLNMHKAIPAVFFFVLATFLILWQANVLTGVIGLAPLSAGVGAGAGETPGVPIVPTGEGCPAGQQVEDTTVTLGGLNKYTSLATGGTHRYRLLSASGNSAFKEVADGGTFTASPGDVLEILYNNASLVNGYFSKVVQKVVPCAGTYSATEGLYQNSSVTITVFNTDKDKITGAVNQTLGAGDVKTLDLLIEGSFQKSQPYGGLLVCDYNLTDFDDCAIDVNGDGVIDETSMPQAFQVLTGRKAKAFAVPAFFGTEKLSGSITIDVDDTNNPASDSMSVVNLTYYSANPYFNEDNGLLEGPAVEDEDDALTLTTKATSIIYVI